MNTVQPHVFGSQTTSRFLRGVACGLVFVGATATHAQNVSLSGTVVTSAQKGLVGVVVQLKHNGTVYQTSSKTNGVWSLTAQGSTTGLQSKEVRANIRQNLSLENGHLLLSLSGRDAQGRPLDLRNGSQGNAHGVAAARTSGLGDTLIYAWKGRELARDVVPNLVQSGLVRVLDTTQQTYVSQLVGTWKGTHLETMVDFVAKADSSVSILRVPKMYGNGAVGYRFQGKISIATADHLLLQLTTVESTTDGKTWLPVAPSLIASFGLAKGLDCTYVLQGSELTLSQALLGGVVPLVRQ